MLFHYSRNETKVNTNREVEGETHDTSKRIKIANSRMEEETDKVYEL